MYRAFLTTLSCALLAGCVSGPDYQRPTSAVPEVWPQGLLSSSAEREDWVAWWQQFEDPLLDRLVQRAIAGNMDIRLQAARVQEARARLGLARAEQLPTVEAQANASRERGSGAASTFRGVGSTTSNLYSLTGLLNYELDIWGRLAREREAAQALLEENVYAREAVELNVVVDVISTYFNLRAAQSQVAITKDTISSREETLKIQDARYDGGDIDELALQQARSQLETAKVELPARLHRVRTLEGALGVLVGLSPAELWSSMEWEELSDKAPVLPEHLPAVLPAELLERRPDIKAAQSAHVSANARIGVAVADRLPKVNLSAFLGTAALSTGELFGSSSETWGIGAGLVGPLWDFGRGKMRVETAEALAAQSKILYEQTVLGAFNEVRDALILFETSEERMTSTRRLVTSLERTNELAKLRYDEGLISFLELLDAQRELLTARLTLEEAQRDQYVATATLFKALGGGWSSPSPVANAQ